MMNQTISNSRTVLTVSPRLHGRRSHGRWLRGLRLIGLLLFGTVLLGVAPSLAAMTGEEVMRRVEDRDGGSTVQALVSMELVDRRGSTSSRIIEGYGAEDADGLSRMVIVFHRPASVQDTRFLVIENPDRDDDQWIYLPALRRVRRIAAGEGNDSFMGTDFTYDDLQSRSVDDDRHELLREERLDGYDCYVVESVPRDRDGAQYSRRVQWIPRDIWVPIKIEFYDKRGDLLKVNSVERLEEVQGYWTPMKSTMKNEQTGHATRLEVQRIQYDGNLPDALFTTRFLETGRVR